MHSNLQGLDWISPWAPLTLVLSFWVFVSLHCSFVLFLSLTLLTQSQSLSRRIEPFNPRVQVIHTIYHKDTHPCALYPLIYLPLLLKAQQGNGCAFCLFPFACVMLFIFHLVFFFIGMILQETLNGLHDQNGNFKRHN